MSRKVHSLKRQLAAAITESIANKRQSQSAAASLCGVAQSRISNVVSGQLDNFSIDSLIDLCDKLGCHVSLNIIPVDKPLSMDQAMMIPKGMTIDPNGFREGCEDEFRMY